MADGDYDFSRLSDRSFEQLVQAIAVKVFGPSTIVFGDGKDGGREATFEGKSGYVGRTGGWDGYIVIQAKFRIRPSGNKQDADWLIEQISRELDHYAARPARRRPKYFVIATNVILSPVEGIGGLDRVRTFLSGKCAELGVVDYDVWDFDKLRSFLDNNSDIRQSFSLNTPGDVMTGVLDTVRELRRAAEIHDSRSAAFLTALVARLRDGTMHVTTTSEGTLSLALPPKSERYVERNGAIRILSDASQRVAWLYIIGPSGSGKSQLARAASVQWNRCVWIRFRELAENQLTVRLDAALRSLEHSGAESDGDINACYRKAAVTLGHGGLFVLDDLPPLTSGSEALERLIWLQQSCMAARVRIISTSAHGPPAALAELPRDSAFDTLTIPPFDDENAATLLMSYGAPKEFCAPARVRFVNLHAKGHPVLLGAAARFFAELGWKFTGSTVERLSRNDYASEITPEVRRRLMSTVPPEARDLLYRLNTVGAEFSNEDARLLATINPPIDRPAEQLARLSGYCLQQETTNTYSVSPVFQLLGCKDVPEDVLQRCHLALADQILSKRNLTPITGMRAIAHFVHAGRVEDAAGVLLEALRSLRSHKRAVHDYGMLGIWIGIPLPSEISLGRRILIRCFQIALCAQRKQETRYLIEDLEKLINISTEIDALSLLLGSVVAGDTIAAQNFVLACNLWSRVLQLRAGAPPATSVQIPPNTVWVGMFTLANRMRTHADLAAWTNTVDQLTADDRRELLTDPDWPEFAVMVSTRLWLAEVEKLQPAQNWVLLGESITALSKAGRRWGSEVLWAAAQRVHTIMLGENLNDVDAAVMHATAALAEASDDPLARFLIEEAIGGQLYFARRMDDARKWLSLALARNIEGFSSTRFFAYLHYACAIGESDSKTAARENELAVAIAEANAGVIPELELNKALAELAIAYHLAGRMEDAFRAWDRAAEMLQGSEDRSDEWKEFFVLFGHVSGYLSLFARTGVGPKSTADGGEYGVPYRGIFGTKNTQRISLYSPRKEAVLPSQLALFAAAVQNDPRSLYWSEKAIQEARESGQLRVLPLIAGDLISLYFENGRFADSASLALESTQIALASAMCRRDGGKGELQIDVSKTLGPRTNNVWLTAERDAMLLLSVPLVMHLGLRFIESDEKSAMEARSAIEVLAKVSASALDKNGWQGISTAIETAFAGNITVSNLIDFGNSFSEDMKVVRIVAYLCDSVKEFGDVNRSVHSHLAVMPFVDKYFASFPVIHHRVTNFVWGYWMKAVSEMRFRFRAPEIVQKSLGAIGPSAIRLRRTLAVVASSLGTRMHQNVRHWIATGEFTG